MKVASINVSERKGTTKHPVERAEINMLGITNDAHSGNWSRQITLLSEESINRFIQTTGKVVKFGDFAENITTTGGDLSGVRLLDHISIGEVEMEVTQIGKECHGDACTIFREVGKCIMPKEGLYCKVLKPGIIETGMEIVLKPKVYRVHVITLSDRASRGEYSDRSGQAIVDKVESWYKSQSIKVEIVHSLIPDDAEQLKKLVEDTCSVSADIIFTCGGTGLGPRDIAPDVIKPLLTKELPGIMEMIRLKYGKNKPGALLSRGVAGLSYKTLIFALPGSVRAAEEYMVEIFSVLNHAIYMVHGLDAH